MQVPNPRPVQDEEVNAPLANAALQRLGPGGEERLLAARSRFRENAHGGGLHPSTRS